MIEDIEHEFILLKNLNTNRLHFFLTTFSELLDEDFGFSIYCCICHRALSFQIGRHKQEFSDSGSRLNDSFDVFFGDEIVAEVEEDSEGWVDVGLLTCLDWWEDLAFIPQVTSLVQELELCVVHVLYVFGHDVSSCFDYLCDRHVDPETVLNVDVDVGFVVIDVETFQF